MRYPFYRHKKKKCISFSVRGKRYDYDLQAYPEYETFVSFNTWKSMYIADKEHWKVYHTTDRDANFHDYGIMMPLYIDPKDKFHFIKFLTRRDYRKFRRFWKKEVANGETYENLKEQEELVTMIRERADQNLKDALKKQAKAEEKVRQQAEKMLEDQKHREESVKETMSKLWHMTGDLYYDPRNGTYLQVPPADADLLNVASDKSFAKETVQKALIHQTGNYYYDPVSNKLFLLDRENKEFKEVRVT